MLEILKKPYPLRTETGFWMRVNFTSGLLVSIILFFIISFQDDVEINSMLIANISLFGLVTFICMSFANLLLPLIFKGFYQESKWTLGRNILWWLILIFIISTGNTLCANFLYNSGFTLHTFAKALYYTVGIGLIINTFFSVLHYKLLLKQHTDTAQLMNAELASANPQENGPSPESVLTESITVTSESEKEKFTFLIKELLFIESADNYSRFFCLKEGKLTDTIIRSSLKRVESQARHTALFRCHRSYLVNLGNIASVSGNAQGYQLYFRSTTRTIPASRNAGKELRGKLQSLKQ